MLRFQCLVVLLSLALAVGCVEKQPPMGHYEGIWRGTYSYPDKDKIGIYFLTINQDEAGTIQGEIVENKEGADVTTENTVKTKYSGYMYNDEGQDKIYFSKSYGALSDRVVYRGVVLDDKITGSWWVPDTMYKGDFEIDISRQYNEQEIQQAFQ